MSPRNRPHARTLVCGVASLLVCIWISPSLVGCRRATSAAPSVPAFEGGGVGQVQSSAAPAIDAGVVFSDRESYLCVPLEKAGLPASVEVVSVTSSCECVRAQVVPYLSSGSTEANGLLLEFVPEPSSATSASGASAVAKSPLDLGVLVNFQLADGTAHRVTVNLLHTMFSGK
jgi:hypothetical protein